MASKLLPAASRAMRLARIPQNISKASSIQSHRHHSTVSAQEVSHFSGLASSWWDPQGSSRILHLMNPLRHEFIQDCLDSSPTPPTSTPLPSDPTRRYRYLDIGTGGGIFAESAARLPSTISVTAIDPTPDVIEVARAHARLDPILSEVVDPTASEVEKRLAYHNIPVELLPHAPSTTSSQSPDSTPQGKYDIVTMFEVIEHVSNPAHFVEQALSHVAPGGWLIGSTISRTLTSYLTTILIAEAPVFGVVPKGTHDWKKYVDPTEVRFWMRERGWGGVEGETWRTRGVIYLPGLGWREVQGSEEWGNYFFGVRKDA